MHKEPFTTGAGVVMTIAGEWTLSYDGREHSRKLFSWAEHSINPQYPP